MVLYHKILLTKNIYNNSGQIKKRIIKNNIVDQDEVLNYSYNKKGQLIRKEYMGTIYKYKYDRNENIKALKIRDSEKDSGDYKYKLTYKNGRAIKQVISNMSDAENNEVITKFKYKKVKVKKEYISIIKKQQWEIINENFYE